MRMLLPFDIDDTTLTASNVVEDLPEWDNGGSYDTGDKVRVEAAHHAYESLVDSNSGNDPTDLNNADKWLDLGATNRWAMFDEKNSTITENADTIDVSFSVDGRVMGIALFGLSAATVQVIVEDDVEGEVFNETFSLVSYENVNDYWDYFFAPIVRRTELLIDGLPLFAGADVRVIIANPDNLAKCGKLVPGDLRTLGVTQIGAGFGLIDYSRKEADSFGNLDLVERGWRATGSFSVKVPYDDVDEVGRILTERRAKRTVFIGAERFSRMLIDGFPRDWDMRVNEHHDADLTMELEGFN